eukprot:TRINITY_DN45741_c0_g1_i2.p1 TRINITY_DN45741_c0_g1~~TRINITY_DN45741_c0_g1_i2.p1  ORF type:complete len:1006 (+),score=313.38 TRINITY_DN45741_c0_g1_i2:65-3019(+)
MKESSSDEERATDPPPSPTTSFQSHSVDDTTHPPSKQEKDAQQEKTKKEKLDFISFAPNAQNLFALVNVPSTSSTLEGTWDALSSLTGSLSSTWLSFRSGSSTSGSSTTTSHTSHTGNDITIHDFMSYLAKMHKSLTDFRLLQERIKRDEAKSVDRVKDIDSLRREFLSTLRRLRDKIPRMYFRESFALEEFRSEVVEKLFESSKPDIELLSAHLDEVESNLSSQISLRSEEFLKIFSLYQEIEKDVLTACSSVGELRSDLSSIDEFMVRDHALVIRLKRRMHRMSQVRGFLKTMQSAMETMNMIERAVEEKDFVVCLELWEAVSRTMDTDLRDIRSLNGLRERRTQLRERIGKDLIRNLLTSLWKIHSRKKGKEDLIEAEASDIVSSSDGKTQHTDDGDDDDASHLNVEVEQWMHVLNRMGVVEQLHTMFRAFLHSKFEEDVSSVIPSCISYLNGTTIPRLKGEEFSFIFSSVCDAWIQFLSHFRGTLDCIKEKVPSYLPLCDAGRVRELQKIHVTRGIGLLEKLLNEYSFRMSVNEFAEIYTTGESAVHGAYELHEEVSVVAHRTLSPVWTRRSQEFVKYFHQKHVDDLVMLVEGESWQKVSFVPVEFQAICDYLEHESDGGVGVEGEDHGMMVEEKGKEEESEEIDERNEEKRKETEIKLESGSYSSSRMMQRIEIARARAKEIDGAGAATITCGGSSFHVSNSLLMLLKMLSEYVDGLERLKWLGASLAVRVAELVKTFVSRSYQMIIGMGAVHTKTLKSIAVRHIAVSAQNLLFLQCLVPMMSRFMGTRVRLDQHVLFETRLQQALEHIHNYRVEHFGHIVAVMENRLNGLLEGFVNSLEQEEVFSASTVLGMAKSKGAAQKITYHLPEAQRKMGKKGLQPSPYVATIVAETDRLWSILEQFFSPLHVREIVTLCIEMFAEAFKKKLWTAFSSGSKLLKLQIRLDIRQFAAESRRWGSFGTELASLDPFVGSKPSVKTS